MGVNKINPQSFQRRMYFFSLTKLHYDSEKRLRAYTPLMSNEEWRPFLVGYSHITIFSRIDLSDRSDEGYHLDDPAITVVPIPYYEGIFEYYRKAPAIRSFVLSQVVDSNIDYCLWAPSQLTHFIAKRVKAIGAPLLVRMIGDPVGVARAILPAPINRVAMFLTAQKTKKTITLADGVIYVTLRTLQESYPPRDDARILARTNVKLTESLAALPKKQYERLSDQNVFSLIAVGSQQQNYKGHDLLIAAVGKLLEAGYPVKLTLVGTGQLHEELKSLAEPLEPGTVTFIERLGSSLEVAQEIIKHDIFLMPSRTEGMPKALLEAMYMGVLALGSNVGGIPEVLDVECVFEPDSVEDIVRTIIAFVEKPDRFFSHLDQQRNSVEKIRKNHSGPEVLQTYIEEWCNYADMTRGYKSYDS